MQFILFLVALMILPAQIFALRSALLDLCLPITLYVSNPVLCACLFPCMIVPAIVWILCPVYLNVCACVFSQSILLFCSLSAVARPTIAPPAHTSYGEHRFSSAKACTIVASIPSRYTLYCDSIAQQLSSSDCDALKCTRCPMMVHF